MVRIGQRAAIAVWWRLTHDYFEYLWYNKAFYHASWHWMVLFRLKIIPAFGLLESEFAWGQGMAIAGMHRHCNGSQHCWRVLSAYAFNID